MRTKYVLANTIGQKTSNAGKSRQSLKTVEQAIPVFPGDRAAEAGY